MTLGKSLKNFRNVYSAILTNLIANRGRLKAARQIVNQQSNVSQCLVISVSMCVLLRIHIYIFFQYIYLYTN